MATLSLCMIVKNEEAVLARCLSSAKDIADEIIIVDTGSTDKTKHIAKQFTRRVFDFTWIDDFAAARNFSFARATKDFIMWLDADDIITNENIKKILTLKQSLNPNIDMVTMKYHLGNETFSTRERIFNRAKNFKWSDPIHEYIAITPTALHSDAAITHQPPERKSHTDRNLRIFEKHLGNLSPRNQYYYARELRAQGRISEAIKYYNLFLNGKQGWIEDNISACLEIAKLNGDLQMLYKTFEYDAPRAEACCMIGYHFKSLGNFTLAANWFETALTLPQRQILGFVNKDFLKYIPAIELAVCYDRLGDYEKANRFNEIAGSAQPTSAEYIANKNYFSTRRIV